MTTPLSAAEQTAAAKDFAAFCPNLRAVMAACGFDLKMTESNCVAKLFKRYRTLMAGGARG